MKVWQAVIVLVIITAAVFIPLAIIDFISNIWWVRSLIMIAAAVFDFIVSIRVIAWMDNRIFIHHIKKKRKNDVNLS